MYTLIHTCIYVVKYGGVFFTLLNQVVARMFLHTCAHMFVSYRPNFSGHNFVMFVVWWESLREKLLRLTVGSCIETVSHVEDKRP